jgi:hypothetical protein
MNEPRADSAGFDLVRVASWLTRGRAFAAGVCAIVAMGSLLPLCARPAVAGDSSQCPLPLVEQMPNVPQPFAILDWKARARAFDRLAFDLNARGEHLPLVTLIDKGKNIRGPSFALPSYVGAGNVGGEGIACLAAVVSGTLSGVDKRDQHGHNWVRMCQEWYNAQNGQKTVLNNPGAATGGSFWYEILPGLLFCQLVDLYPQEPGMEAFMRATADRWREACWHLGGREGRAEFDWTAFNLATKTPVFNGRWREPDAAAGIGWIEYMAWRKWRDPKYLEAADWCMESLERRKAAQGSPLYEVLLYCAPCLAARMNAELERHYDLDKLLAWCFSANNQPGVPRRGWGTIAARFGGYDCYGLQGSTTDGGGYAFAMNTFDAAGLIVPLVRYDARYARAVGKWMLNLANAARLFYPDVLPERLQSSYGWRGDPDHAVAYEGLRRQAVVAPTPRSETTLHGRLLSGSILAGIAPDRPESLAADDVGRLEHVWEFAIPPDAVDAPFWMDLRCDAPAGSFTLSGSYGAQGPWQMLSRFPRREESPGAANFTSGSLGEPRGHRTFYVRLESRAGMPPKARMVIQRWRWRIALDRSPFATGDVVINDWGGKTDFGVYGAAHVGYLAALVARTNHEHILRLDLLPTDFFHDRAYPTYLYFNPDPQGHDVAIDVGTAARDLYETTHHRFLKRNVCGVTTFRLPGDSAAVIVVVPPRGIVRYQGKKMSIDATVVDFAAADEH